MATLVSEIGATVDYTNPLDPILSIPYGAIAAAGEWDAPPDAVTENLEPWLMAIIRSLANFTSNATTEESNITTQFGGKGIATRNSLSKTTYAYNLTFFQVDNSPAAPDADNF